MSKLEKRNQELERTFKDTNVYRFWEDDMIVPIFNVDYAVSALLFFNKLYDEQYPVSFTTLNDIFIYVNDVINSKGIKTLLKKYDECNTRTMRLMSLGYDPKVEQDPKGYDDKVFKLKIKDAIAQLRLNYLNK